MRYLLPLLLLTSQAQAQNEPLVEKVRTAIDRGVGYLRANQRDGGSWEHAVVVEGGQTCLASLALLTCGVPPNDPMMKKGLDYVRNLKSNQTYVRSLQAMVLAEANLPQDRALLKDHCDWLVKNRVLTGGKLLGWTYTDKYLDSADASNTQYAVLGLWAGKQAGIDVKDAIFEEIRQMYLDGQDKSGAWVYATGPLSPDNRASITMTSAGVSGLLIAGLELNNGRESFKGMADPAQGCGVYRDTKAVERGLGWINDGHFAIEIRARTFYNLYGLERVGRISGQRFLGDYDWYREGVKFLLPMQKQSGEWKGTGQWDQWPIVSTSMGLLFLSKGRTPVLMSKVVHGNWPRLSEDQDWNNDRNDLRYLVAYASKEIFKRQPLAWQNVDMMKAAVPGATRRNLSEDDIQGLTSDLLQSPILYITGHKSPEHRFTATEKDLLKRYVDSGGFILAEACCGSEEFDTGFKKLLAEVWPDHDLAPLGPEHPVWQSPRIVRPGQPYQLYGLSQGCKTVLIYSPQDLSCRWESNKPEDPRCITAFHVGLNIIAYATGMQPPQDRGYQAPVASNRADPPTLPRGVFKVAQLKHGGDWHPAPKAMRNLMENVNAHAGLTVALKTETRPIHDRDLVDFKFLYMHGRNSFAFDRDDLESLRFNLKNGSLLFADACCGREEFAKSFKEFAEAVLPGSKFERVPANDLLYSKDLGGDELSDKTIRGRLQSGQPFQPMAPVLEGIKYDGRWVVLFSPYDIGCALEKHQSSDCRGYDNVSAQKIARAAVLYTLRP